MKDIPEPIQVVIEEVAENLIEDALGLEEGTIEIDLSAGDEPCKEKEEDNKDAEGDEES